jgi:hypothetical protein
MRAFTLMFAAFATSFAYADAPTQRPVAVELGPKAYRDGDVIQITGVTATSPRLEQGDTITVKGRVRLDSVERASLDLYLTQTEGDGLEETDESQATDVGRGVSDFELTITIKHRGALHLTLYRASDGKPIGGVYFGTREQMEAIAGWDVGYYLQD